MSNIADAGFSTTNGNGNKENTEVNKEIVDESNVETVQKNSKGEDQRKIKNLKYPLDDNDYRGTLVFHTIIESKDNTLADEIGGTEFDKAQQKIIDKFEADVEKELIEEGGGVISTDEIDELQADVDSLAQNKQVSRVHNSAAAKEYREKKKLIQTLRGKEIDKRVKSKENGFQNSLQEDIPELSSKKITLYMPMALNFRDNVGYENVDLGFSGGLIEGGLAGNKNRGKLGDTINSVLSGTGQTLGSLFGKQSGELATLAALQVNVVAKALGEGAVSAVRQAGGVRLNPNTRSLFKSVALREFAFQFKFIAKSFREAEEVKEIIQFFREELYPEDIEIPIGDEGNMVSVGYRFPKKFQIDVLYDGKPIANKIKPCFLRDVSVVYNPTNQTMHGGDNPHFTEIDMSLAFTESRTLSRKDVVHEGY